MNSYQTKCTMSETIPFYLPQQLYLKPIARMTITIPIPNLKKLNKSISNWEIMEKLRALVKPHEFTVLKVTKNTSEYVQFEAEIENKSKLSAVLGKLDNMCIRLKDFNDFFRVKAGETEQHFPGPRQWDAFFQEAKNMNEMRPGERPDTVHLSNLPIKWFIPPHLEDEEDITPSEKMFFKIFDKFGPIRHVDIPICDPYRKLMKDHISGIKKHPASDKQLFEGYVQFKDYIGFAKTMEALKGMKLVKRFDSEEIFACDIRVDFDKTKHLSDASVTRREIVRDRLVRKQLDKEKKDREKVDEKRKREELESQKQIDEKAEKARRRKEREERRKARILDKLKISGCDELNEKISREEKKLLVVQRKLESVRLLEELFRRIKDKKGDKERNVVHRISKNNELQHLKDTSELEVLMQREKLNDAIEGRVVLKNILSEKGRRSKSRSLSLESDASSKDEDRPEREEHYPNPMMPPELLGGLNWFGLPYGLTPGVAAMYPVSRGFSHMDRGSLRNNFVRASRGRPGFANRRYRAGFRGGAHPNTYNRNDPRHAHPGYPPPIEDEYVKYFSKFLDVDPANNTHNRHHYGNNNNNNDNSSNNSYNTSNKRWQHDDRDGSSSGYRYDNKRERSPYLRRHSRSRSRSRSPSRSRSRRSRSRSLSRSRTRSRDRGRRSRSRSRDNGNNAHSSRRSRSRSRRSSRSRSRSRNSRSRDRRSRSRHSTKSRRSRSSHTKERSNRKRKGSSRSRSRKTKTRSKTRSRSKSRFKARSNSKSRSKSKSPSVTRADREESSGSNKKRRSTTRTPSPKKTPDDSGKTK